MSLSLITRCILLACVLTGAFLVPAAAAWGACGDQDSTAPAVASTGDAAFLAAHQEDGRDLSGGTTMKESDIAIIVLGSVCLLLLILIIVL